MTKKKPDPMVESIEYGLNFGTFISYDHTWGFISELEAVKKQIDKLVDQDPQRAAQLYESFLSGCHEKMEEIDDSGGDMGMFFEDLFSSWAIAKQKAKTLPEEILRLVAKWQDNDDYGLCHDIEKRLIKVFNKETLNLFLNNTKRAFENEYKNITKEDLKPAGYPYSLRHNIEVLKLIYKEKKDYHSFIDLSHRLGTTPNDCVDIAEIFVQKKRYNDALKWVDKGYRLESDENSIRFPSYELQKLKKEILNKTGKKDEVLNITWQDFKENPNEIAYDELMRYVPKTDKKLWHKKIIDIVKKGPIGPFIEICTKTREWDILADRILLCKHQSLECLSHYTTESAAKGLAKRHFAAAAKVYRALGVRIAKSRKSKYYQNAIESLASAKVLYHKAGLDQEWTTLVGYIRTQHSRQYGFINDFENMISGALKKKKSFAERARSRWK